LNLGQNIFNIHAMTKLRAGRLRGCRSRSAGESNAVRKVFAPGMCQHKSSHHGIPGAYGAVYFHRRRNSLDFLIPSMIYSWKDSFEKITK